MCAWFFSGFSFEKVVAEASASVVCADKSVFFADGVSGIGDKRAEFAESTGSFGGCVPARSDRHKKASFAHFFVPKSKGARWAVYLISIIQHSSRFFHTFLNKT
jgi:hypothetical protein